ncbi:glycoprotease family protein [Besnoitia besnoiti]|uniref:N(6)-L-threonylcarbamoyladenine synthase n=1 Tax=Besnoitia besnoiti TaxID=94643 RepID=A0A2A9MM98_BESBE|nr:glycoprotease family protein [Besnoitia besnoiti]PFH38444.1 glycoprotease family protein [Besnoitia besnoiti]
MTVRHSLTACCPPSLRGRLASLLCLVFLVIPLTHPNSSILSWSTALTIRFSRGRSSPLFSTHGFRTPAADRHAAATFLPPSTSTAPDNFSRVRERLLHYRAPWRHAGSLMRSRRLLLRSVTGYNRFPGDGPAPWTSRPTRAANWQLPVAWAIWPCVETSSLFFPWHGLCQPPVSASVRTPGGRPPSGGKAWAHAKLTPLKQGIAREQRDKEWTELSFFRGSAHPAKGGSYAFFLSSLQSFCSPERGVRSAICCPHRPQANHGVGWRRAACVAPTGALRWRKSSNYEEKDTSGDATSMKLEAEMQAEACASPPLDRWQASRGLDEAIRLHWLGLRQMQHDAQRRGKQLLVLGIETSCDDTCVGIIEGASGAVLSNVCAAQPELLIKYGGVHPSEAAATHRRRIRSVVRKALRDAGVSLLDIDVLAFTRGPGLVPCLSVGAAAAVEIAAELEAAWRDAAEQLRGDSPRGSPLSRKRASEAPASPQSGSPSRKVHDQWNGSATQTLSTDGCDSTNRRVQSVFTQGGNEGTSAESRDSEGARGGEPRHTQNTDEFRWLSKEEHADVFRRLSSTSLEPENSGGNASAPRPGPPIVLAVNHLHGHLFSAGREPPRDAGSVCGERQGESQGRGHASRSQFLALLVSGGHTFSCIVKPCDHNHLHLRPKVFRVPVEVLGPKAPAGERRGDVGNSQTLCEAKRREETSEAAQDGMERPEEGPRESLKGQSTPPVCREPQDHGDPEGGPLRDDDETKQASAEGVHGDVLQKGGSTGKDGAACGRTGALLEVRNSRRYVQAEVWGTWDDAPGYNPDGCVSGLHCVYTGQTEDDAIGEAIDKCMRCLMTGTSSVSHVASSSPPGPPSPQPECASSGPASRTQSSLGRAPAASRRSSPSAPFFLSQQHGDSGNLAPQEEELDKEEGGGSSQDGARAPGGSSGSTEGLSGRAAAMQGRHGGALMEDLAAGGNANAVPLPSMLTLKPKTLNFSFSGMKSAFAAAVAKADGQLGDVDTRRDFAASLQSAVFKHLEDQLRKTMWLCEFVKDFPRELAVVGGVSCNDFLRRRLHELCKSRGDASVHELEFKRLKNRLKVLARRLPESLLSEASSLGHHASTLASSRDQASPLAADGNYEPTSPAEGRDPPASPLHASLKNKPSHRSLTPCKNVAPLAEREQTLLAEGLTHHAHEMVTKKDERQHGDMHAEAFATDRNGVPAAEPPASEGPRQKLDRKLRAFSFSHYCRLRVDLRALVLALSREVFPSPNEGCQQPIFCLAPSPAAASDAKLPCTESRAPGRLTAEKESGTHATGTTSQLGSAVDSGCGRMEGSGSEVGGSRVGVWNLFSAPKSLCNDNGVMIAWAALSAMQRMDAATGWPPACDSRSSAGGTNSGEEEVTSTTRSRNGTSANEGLLAHRETHVLQAEGDNMKETSRDAAAVRTMQEGRTRTEGEAWELNETWKSKLTLSEGDLHAPPKPSEAALQGKDKELVTPKWLGGTSLCADDILAKVEMLILEWLVTSDSSLF